MAVYVSMWSLRIGTFWPCYLLSSTDDTTPYLEFNLLLLLFRLLVIAGIESNPGPSMYACKKCGAVCRTPVGYCNHVRKHSNDRKFIFECCFERCLVRCSTYVSLKNHIYREHGSSKRTNLATETSLKVNFEAQMFSCQQKLCTKKFDSLHRLICHLKEHLKKKDLVNCPFSSCNLKLFRTTGAFSMHILRYHRDSPQESTQKTNISMENTISQVVFHEEDTIEDDDLPINGNILETDLLEELVGKFYMKLEAEYLLPNSTIQAIADDIRTLSSVIHDCISKSLLKTLLETGMCVKNANQLITNVMKNDILYHTHCNDENSSHTANFATPHLRKSYFKKKFKFVSPVDVYIGKDHLGFDRFYHYVPIKNTLQILLEDETIQDQIIKSWQADSGGIVLNDFTDGKMFEEHFKGMDVLNVLLYQDEFEVVNPLGSAKSKHKLFAVYFTIGNLQPEFRSKLESINLLLLCKSKYLNKFGLSASLRSLVDDLRSLETNGISLHGKVIKVCVNMIMGDNLGSHLIGGFQTSFNAEYFCRYCAITAKEFHATPYAVNSLRTTVEYDDCVRRCEETGNSVKGIKKNSEFNGIGKYHVCNPGLPPCLGHDLFEGVVDYDMAIFLQDIITNKKWFSYEILNKRMECFVYLGKDRTSKPNKISTNSKRLGGTASQNWCFLRMLPLFLFDLIEDCEDEVWQLILQLKLICEYLCAPKLSKSQISYVRTLIHEYVESRQDMFPLVPLRPKHHFLLHYPSLILQFGPLIRCWTMRFESKHSYFKRCVRSCKNFINITKSLSLKHQLLFAYQTSEKIYERSFSCGNVQLIDLAEFKDSVKEVLKKTGVTSDWSETSVVQVYGTEYRTGMWVILPSGEDECVTGSVTFGQIKSIFVKDSELPCLMVTSHEGMFCFGSGVYEVDMKKINLDDFKCFKLSDLADYYCLPAYRVLGHTYISLKHSVCFE